MSSGALWCPMVLDGALWQCTAGARLISALSKRPYLRVPGHSSRNIYLHSLPPGAALTSPDTHARQIPSQLGESTGPSHATPFLVRNLWQAVVTSGRPLSLARGDRPRT